MGAILCGVARTDAVAPFRRQDQLGSMLATDLIAIAHRGLQDATFIEQCVAGPGRLRRRWTGGEPGCVRSIQLVRHDG